MIEQSTSLSDFIYLFTKHESIDLLNFLYVIDRFRRMYYQIFCNILMKWI